MISIDNVKSLADFFTSYHLKCGIFPNCILYGTHGCGKSFIASKIADEINLIDKSTHVKYNYIGCGIDRGVSSIRSIYDDYIKKTNIMTIIILDEVETLTDEAQLKFFNIYKSNKYVSFILCSCILSKINDNIIKSFVICIIKQQSIDVLTSIIKSKCSNIANENILSILKFSNGDIRAMLNCCSIIQELQLNDVSKIIDYINNNKFLSFDFFKCFNVGDESILLSDDFVDNLCFFVYEKIILVDIGDLLCDIFKIYDLANDISQKKKYIHNSIIIYNVQYIIKKIKNLILI